MQDGLNPNNETKVFQGIISGEGIGPKAEVPQVLMRELDYSNAPTLQPIGFRFIIPVPDLGVENKTIEVTNWKGEKEVIVGYGFRNTTDGAQQAVQGDGNGVILVLVDQDKFDRGAVSQAILSRINKLGGVGALTPEKLDNLLNFIREEVGITDLYNSTDSIAQSMEPQGALGSTVGRPLGLFEKKDKAGPVGVYVDGASQVLDGPHAGKAMYESGFLAVRIPPKKEGGEFTYRSIHPDAITSCYKLADGAALTSPKTQLPVTTV